MKLYFENLGGKMPITFWALFLGGMLGTSVIETFQAWFLGYWASQYEHYPAEEVSVFKYAFRKAGEDFG